MTRYTDTLSLRPDVIGVYAPYRAGALAGVSGQSIGQWARHGLVRPTVYEGRPANLYSYLDVAEAIVVRWLLNEGITHTQIRSALASVRDDYPDWPLLNAPLGIARQSIDDPGSLVRKTADRVYIDVSGRAPGQIVIKPMMLAAARDMLERGGWLADQLGLDRIEVAPLKLGGQPSIRGRRWAVDHVARLGADEQGRRILVDSYGLEPAEVDQALAWSEAAATLA